MSHNYTNYSKFNAAAVEPAVREAVEAPVEPEVNAELEEITNTMPIDETTLLDAGVIEEEVEEEPAKPEPKTGIVTANKLNIRKLPAIGAQVVAVVDQNAALMIDRDYETVEWIKVCTAAGIEGYCMKKFVEVK